MDADYRRALREGDLLEEGALLREAVRRGIFTSGDLNDQPTADVRCAHERCRNPVCMSDCSYCTYHRARPRTRLRALRPVALILQGGRAIHNSMFICTCCN